MVEARANKTNAGDPLPAFAFTNAGGIRASINEGDITRGEVLTTSPFGNEIVDLKLTGQQIWDMFEGVLARVNKNSGKKVTSFVQVSKEIEVLWTPTNATANPSIGKLTAINIGGKPIQPDEVYRVVTIDFLATGGDSILFPKMPSPQIEGLVLVLEKYIISQTPVNIQLEGRLKPVPAKSCKRRRSIGENRKRTL